MPQVCLKTKDNVLIEMKLSLALRMRTINELIMHCGLTQDNEIIPIPNVESSVMQLIALWLEHHEEDDTPELEIPESERKNLELPEWDAEFLNIDHNLLFGIVNASDYLNIPGLLAYSCKKTAELIQGKFPDEIRQIFNINNDFTPDEIVDLEEENYWCSFYTPF